MDWRIHRFEVVDSTNEVAFEALARGDGRPGDVFIAQRQTAGRGTRGRSWLSEPGGLYMSVILQTPTLPAPGLWTIAGALAALDLARALGVAARLDWPNDLVNHDGAKLGGILAESRGLGPRGPATYVLGIGVNLEASALKDAPRSGIIQDRRVAALLPRADSGHGSVDPEKTMLAALARRTRVALDDAETLFLDFFDHCVQAHQPVRVDIAGNLVRGTFAALDAARGVYLTPEAGVSPGGTCTNARWLPLAHVRSMTLIGDAD